MRIKNYLSRPRAVIMMMAAALPLLLSGCKGRTAENMTPTGDTVEVVINPADTQTSPDTIANNDSIQHEI